MTRSAGRCPGRVLPPVEPSLHADLAEAGLRPARSGRGRARPDEWRRMPSGAFYAPASGAGRGRADLNRRDRPWRSTPPRRGVARTVPTGPDEDGLKDARGIPWSAAARAWRRATPSTGAIGRRRAAVNEGPRGTSRGGSARRRRATSPEVTCPGRSAPMIEVVERPARGAASRAPPSRCGMRVTAVASPPGADDGPARTSSDTRSLPALAAARARGRGARARRASRQAVSAAAACFVGPRARAIARARLGSRPPTRAARARVIDGPGGPALDAPRARNGHPRRPEARPPDQGTIEIIVGFAFQWGTGRPHPDRGDGRWRGSCSEPGRIGGYRLRASRQVGEVRGARHLATVGGSQTGGASQVPASAARARRAVRPAPLHVMLEVSLRPRPAVSAIARSAQC